MKVLMLAPHRFFVVLGTPIALRYFLRALSELGHEVDMLTYPQGEDVVIKNVTVTRIPKIPIVKKIPIGFSWQKLVLDFFLFFQCIKIMRKNKYDVVHATEEAAFIAYVMKKIFGVPYIYDMDCSMVQNMLQNYPKLQFLHKCLSIFEKFVVKHSMATIPVCKALADIVQSYDKEKKVSLIQDIAMFDEGASLNQIDSKNDFRGSGIVIMYIGNLEKHQGIHLLIESFAMVIKKQEDVSLVIIGGSESDVEHYKEFAGRFNVLKKMYFLGTRPPEELSGFLKEADILVSSRIRGNNTPMKIYSYLLSGKPIVATRCYTHTQVLTDEVSVLTNPVPEDFAEGILKVIRDPDFAKRIGKAAKELAKREYSYEVFKNKVAKLYTWIEETVVS